jgi:hypothetical protein
MDFLALLIVGYSRILLYGGLHMLTPAQQKIRQELKEFQVRGLTLPNHVKEAPSKQRSKKNWTSVGLLFLLVACSFLATAIYKQQGHENIETYLARILAYDEQSDQLLKHSIGVPPSDPSVLQALSTQKGLLRKTKEIEAPPSFKDHKQDFINLIEQRLMILDSLPQKKVIALDVEQELVKDSLVKAFQKEKIKYIWQEDGTIQYWLNSRSFQYN